MRLARVAPKVGTKIFSLVSRSPATSYTRTFESRPIALITPVSTM